MTDTTDIHALIAQLTEERDGLRAEIVSDAARYGADLATLHVENERLRERAFDERCPGWFRLRLHGLADQAAKCHWHNVVFRLIDVLGECRIRLAKGLNDGSVRDEMNAAIRRPPETISDTDAD